MPCQVGYFLEKLISAYISLQSLSPALKVSPFGPNICQYNIRKPIFQLSDHDFVLAKHSIDSDEFSAASSDLVIVLLSFNSAVSLL